MCVPIQSDNDIFFIRNRQLTTPIEFEANHIQLLYKTFSQYLVFQYWHMVYVTLADLHPLIFKLSKLLNYLTFQYFAARTKFDEARTKFDDARTKFDDVRTKFDDVRTKFDDARNKFDDVFILNYLAFQSFFCNKNVDIL